MSNNRKRRLAAALAKTVNVKWFHSRKWWSNTLVICNLGQRSPGKGGDSVGKVHFPHFPLYMANTGTVISLKSGVFAVALLDKAMPHSLSPHANVMIP